MQIGLQCTYEWLNVLYMSIAVSVIFYVYLTEYNNNLIVVIIV